MKIFKANWLIQINRKSLKSVKQLPTSLFRETSKRSVPGLIMNSLRTTADGCGAGSSGA